MGKIVAYVDGGSRGNPGPSGIGVVLKIEGIAQGILHYSEFIGLATNNVAEYKASMCAMKLALALGITELEIRSDSLLVVNQMNLVYNVQNNTLYEMWVLAQALAGKFETITFTHIYRGENESADKLANEAMDRGK